MSGKLEGKYVVITGGAQGIGLAGVEKFISEGALVWIADINEEKGRREAERLGCHFVKCNVSSSPEVQTMLNTMPRLDVIYNNAGIYWVGHDARITDIDDNDWERVMAINLRSVFLFCKYGIRKMLEQGTGGSIINTASSAGIIGIPDCDAYTATKGAIVQLT
ncbi:MAG: SDR family NAD(P)-dependent oxidoreductase, partial [Victivallales bacterium]|nr:SDR family NAD(P)-dependent oxidoreductase [Victivallales bacterium]